MIHIEIHYFDGCPHADAAINLGQRYHEKYPETVLDIINVDNIEKAEKIGFRGSPTILINDQDMAGAPRPEEPRMACRYYADGLPDFPQFEKIVQEFEK